MKKIKHILLLIGICISIISNGQTADSIVIDSSVALKDTSSIVLKEDSAIYDTVALTLKEDSIRYDTLSLQNLYREILKDSIKFPEIVLKQAILETGWLKSNYCINRHNLFGFRSAKGYLYYDSWQASVLAYKKWQDKHYKGGDYYQFLINIHYAANGIEYVNYLKKIKIPEYVFEK